MSRRAPHPARCLAGLACFLLWTAPSAMAGEVYRVCLVQNPGFVNCTVGDDPSNYSGLEIELIGMVAANLGWVQVHNASEASGLTQPAYTLVCTDQRVPAIISVLTNKTNSPNMTDCALGMGAFTATSERVQMGARFSWPHLHSSLGIMVAADTQQAQYDKWAFLKPFAPQIWVAVLLTTILTPCILLLFENLIQTGRIPLGFALLTEWRHASYVMFLCCFNLQVLEVLSWPCQLMVVCFAFSNLIVVASYTANLAAVLTAAAVTGGIQTIQDLYGRAVAAHALYIERLLKNEFIRAMPLSWAGEPTFLEVKQRLLDGNLVAYIFDRAILQYWMGHDDTTCQLRLLPNAQVEPFDYGVAFNWRVNESVVRDFSLGVLTVQSTGMLSVLEERYISGASNACNNVGGNFDNALQFAQVSGLFIILGAAAGLGLLVSLYAIWWHHIGKPRKQKQRAQESKEQPSTDAKLLQDAAAELEDTAHTPSTQGSELGEPAAKRVSSTLGMSHLPCMREEEEDFISVDKREHPSDTLKLEAAANSPAHNVDRHDLQHDAAYDSQHGSPASQDAEHTRKPSTASQASPSVGLYDTGTGSQGPTGSRRMSGCAVEESGIQTPGRQASGARKYWAKLSKVASASKRLASQVFVLEKEPKELNAEQHGPHMVLGPGYFARTVSNLPTHHHDPQPRPGLISVSALQKRDSRNERQATPFLGHAYTPYVLAPSPVVPQPQHQLSGQVYGMVDNPLSYVPDVQVSGDSTLTRQQAQAQFDSVEHVPQQRLVYQNGRLVAAPAPYGPGVHAVAYPPTRQRSAPVGALPPVTNLPFSPVPASIPLSTTTSQQQQSSLMCDNEEVTQAGQRPHLGQARSASQGAVRRASQAERPAVIRSATVQGRTHAPPQRL